MLKKTQFFHSLLINCNQVSWEYFMAVCVMHKRCLWLTEARLCIYMYTSVVNCWSANCSASHYSDVIMSAMASQITSLAIVYSTVYSGTDHRKHQSSALLSFVRGIHRWPVNSPHKWPVTRKMFPFDDVIMKPIHEPTINQNKFFFHEINFDDSIYKCRPFCQIKASVCQIQVDTCCNDNVVIMVLYAGA